MKTHAEWMTDERRRPMIVDSLQARIIEMRSAAKKARNAYKQDYFGAPWTWFGEVLDETADTLQATLDALTAAERQR